MKQKGEFFTLYRSEDKNLCFRGEHLLVAIGKPINQFN